MNATFDSARLHREELDREIDSLRTERLIRAASPARVGLPARARAGLGRGLIAIGTSLVGTADAAAAATRSAGSRSRA
jgi:uncharacterized protein (UPF0254 family)